MERELTREVAMAGADGRLRQDAIGWSRRPLHQCNVAGHPRAHAFDYWCVMSREAALTVLVADVGFAGAALASVLDLRTERLVERVHVRPRGLGVAMPASTDDEVAVAAWRLALTVGPRRLAVHARTLGGHRIDADVTIERPPGHQTVNVLVPWDDTRFHFTSKQQAMPASGEVRVDGTRYRLDPATDAFACRDFGRGRWPRGIDWGWAFASWRSGAHTCGLNLGAGRIDGTGVTENALIVDGRVHKIAEAVDFETDRRDPRRPWRIRTRGSDRVDLVFTPITARPVMLPPVLRLRQCMGRFSGAVVDDAGGRVRVDGALALAETVRGRW